MARYAGTVEDDRFGWRDGEDWKVNFEREQTALQEYLEVSRELPEGSLVGFVASFGVADGKALYLVVSERPLALKHIPFGDAYHISAAEMRGLRLDDILAQQRFELMWAKKSQG